jgi:hypothetical protein
LSIFDKIIQNHAFTAIVLGRFLETGENRSLRWQPIRGCLKRFFDMERRSKSSLKSYGV